MLLKLKIKPVALQNQKLAKIALVEEKKRNRSSLLLMNLNKCKLYIKIIFNFKKLITKRVEKGVAE